jgi:hypothetical protein
MLFLQVNAEEDAPVRWQGQRVFQGVLLRSAAAG